MKRNFGIDLLRMFLMLMIIILHTLGHGGVLSATEPISVKYSMYWLLESLAFCAVNCYALITGYVHYGKKHKFSALIQLWLHALVYAFGIAVCVWFLKPEEFSLENLTFFLFPVSKRVYWYLTAYTGLFVLIPLLNAGIDKFTKCEAKRYSYLLLLVFSIIPTIAQNDTFYTNSGYSTFWLAYLYIIGACIKKHEWGASLKSRKAALLYICSVLLAWGIKLIIDSTSSLFPGASKFDFDIISYTSPAMVFAAIFLFMAFKNVHIPHKLRGIISSLSPASFGVYLIHEHTYVRKYLIANRFTFFAEYSLPFGILGILSCSLIIFFVCLFVDWIRCKIFSLLHLKELLEHLESKYIRHASKDI